ncbi:neuronal membrane glycoprotein M6-b [Trichonephila clavipes]|nr:neuronal membrane glycoprotein M6-b [Trichonephila clavipes]
MMHRLQQKWLEQEHMASLRDAGMARVIYAQPYYILSFVASVVVLISLLHYIMCLAANYTRIKDQEKFKDLQELQYLQDSEMGL